MAPTERISRLKEDLRARYPLIPFLENHGIRLRPCGGGWVAANCPFPNHADDSPSFKINRKTPTRFYCFGCNAAGDIFRFLEAYLGYRTLTDQLRYLTGRSLRDWLDSPDSLGQAPEPASAPGSTGNSNGSGPRPSIRLADSALHAVYSTLLHILPLEPSHQAELLSTRKLPGDVAYALGYRTLPVSLVKRTALCRSLRGMGLDLWRVPGFFRLPSDSTHHEQWCFGGNRHGLREVTDPVSGKIWQTRGLLIPTRNPDNEIVRLIVRNSQAPHDASPRLFELWPQKYMVLSSPHRYGGAGAPSTVHCAGPKSGGSYPGTVWVTEGQIKADIAAYHLGGRFLGQPGVSLCIQQVIDVAQSEKAHTLRIAHDAEDKIHVLAAIRKLSQRALSRGISPAVVLWDPDRGKGFDDLLAAGGPWEVRTADEWWAGLSDVQRASIQKRVDGSCTS
jgi:hypothetical protein